MFEPRFDPEAMTAEGLAALLQQETDEDALLMAAEEYARRLEQQGVEIPPAEEAWAEFRTHYMPAEMLLAESADKNIKRRSVRRIWRKIASAAVAAAIGFTLITATAYAVGFPIFDWIPEWRGDRFIIQWDEPETQPNPKKVLEKYNITRTSTPSWVPEYYQLLRYIDGPVGGASVYYWGIAPGLKFSVIPYYKGMEVEHEDKGSAEAYRANGITYYIFTGFKSTEVIWMEEGCECSIFWGQSITQTKKLLQKMQES